LDQDKFQKKSKLAKILAKDKQPETDLD